ncbi:hypothetical protein KUTeg_015003 [Tegillarca granosa]|uniref:SRCR domain-containing protein n=1 Tax=Tegillarca granosa TaxID=220873 RepID=A0ABQ9ENV6_TEGGR|nr:hypothetical protein KUTeg_015003 [Tegillarca granosa]
MINNFANIKFFLGGVEVGLVGGNSSFEGRVEIKANGTWGTLCDSSWSFYDAKVICSMIGFRYQYLLITTLQKITLKHLLTHL